MKRLMGNVGTKSLVAACLIVFVALFAAGSAYQISASSTVCCECTGNKWAQTALWVNCGTECGLLGEGWTNKHYTLRSGATCGVDCSNAASTCGANPNLEYVWGIGKRCNCGFFYDRLCTCSQTSTSGSTAFTCTQDCPMCGSLGSGIECTPHNNAPGSPVAGSACQACPGGGSSPGSSCSSATCCLGVDPDCCSVCVDKDSDTSNCGSCGNACTGTTPGCCSGSCKDLDSDKHYCGSCDNDCTTDYGDKNDPNNQCINGVCCDPNVIRLSSFTATSGGTPLTSQGFRLLWQLAGVTGLVVLVAGGVVWSRHKRR